MTSAKVKGKNCEICQEIWKRGQCAIKCVTCDKFVHAPGKKQKSCSLLSPDEYITIKDQNRWVCPKCSTNEIPFKSLSNNDLYFLNNISLQGSSELHLIPDERFESFINECNSIDIESSNESSENSLEWDNNINSKYYHLHQFNNIKTDPQSTLGICHTNIASLSKHIDELKITLAQLKYKPQIIGISEHKIRKDYEPTTNIEIEGYRPFIYDPTETTHGGTGFYLSNSMNFINRDDLKFNSAGNFESTFVEIIIPQKKNLIVGCIYRHPSSSVSINEFNNIFIEPLLNKISSEDKICTIMGDFNIDLLCQSQTKIADFQNLMSSHFFAPFITQPTRPISKTLIDNIFVNSIDYKSYSGNLTIQLSDHLFQFVLLEGFFKDIYPRKIEMYERNFKYFNEREFQEELNRVNWEEILCLNQKDPNLSMNNLYKTLVYILDEHAPYRKISKREAKLKQKPWIDKEILKQMNKRDKILHKYQKSSNVDKKSSLYEEYKSLRNVVTKMKRDAKKNYYKEFFETNRTNLSLMWKGIRSIVKIRSSSKRDITLIDVNGKKITDPKMIANFFNNFFVTVGTDIEKSIPKPKISFVEYLKTLKTKSIFILTPTTPSQISEIINSLDKKKSTGPNSVPVHILKLYNNFFSENLSKVINLSFATGIFPDLCKIAKVIPIFKKENELLCENYRPISLLPVFSKIIEKTIYIQLYNYLTKNNLIYNRQFGFRSGHSTDHALISLTEGLKSHMDKGLFSAEVFIDLQKAFDTVNHQILIEKLPKYGIKGTSCNIISSFLSNRKQFVSIQGFDSEILEVKCGVPQGSTLGPLLFLLYINDLRFCLDKATSNHFADDTCIIFNNINKKPKTLETILNKELKAVVEWLNANRLSLNVKKSNLLLFHSKRKNIDYNSFSIKLNGKKLTPKNHVKHLGMFIDNFLSWDEHINELSKKLSRFNGIISKLRHYLPKKNLISVYHAIFHSNLRYGCMVWSQSTVNKNNRLKILQKKCIRLMYFAPYNCHTANLFKETKILRVDDVIKNEQIKFAFQFINNKLPSDLGHLIERNLNKYSTRSMVKGSLVIPKITTVSYGERSLRYKIPKNWNDFIKTCQKDFTNVKFLNTYLKEMALEN